MNRFPLHLYSATGVERIDGVTSFVGEDQNGQFGLLAHHERFSTVLVYGLARFCVGASDWRYLAMPGAVLYFADNALHISTRRYIQGADFHAVSRALDEQLLAEEQGLVAMKRSLQTLERAMFQRLWRMEER
jgi:F-type H+-transporting ATPase subunit epsilon